MLQIFVVLLKMKLLIVEDEPELRESITEYLDSETHICESAPNLFLAEDLLLTQSFDMILLDIGLPDGNGLDLLQFIKKYQENVGILIISAKDSLDDKLNGLNLGADDYLTKPFHLAELNARIKAIYRRRNFDGESTVTFHEITANTESRQVFVHEKTLNLTKKEYELLLFFLANQNKVLTKSQITEHLWSDYLDTMDNLDFVYTHIKNLRKKIESAGGDNYIKTVYGIGYKFQ